MSRIIIKTTEKSKLTDLPGYWPKIRGETGASRAAACAAEGGEYNKDSDPPVGDLHRNPQPTNDDPGRAAEMLKTCEKLECDVVGLQETRPYGKKTFVRQGYAVYCSGVLTAGECGGEREQKGQQRGVALAVT